MIMPLLNTAGSRPAAEPRMPTYPDLRPHDTQ